MVEHDVALITDTHFGVRSGSKIFHDYMEEFYRDVFFPTLKARNVDTLIHLGDCFDSRRGVDSWSVDWAKRVFFDPLSSMGIRTHVIVGNHDSFYKNTLSVNSPELLLTGYDNVLVHSCPTPITIKNHMCFFVPWICEDNSSTVNKHLMSMAGQAEYCFGHFEFAGFKLYENFICEHGMNSDLFNHKRVFSGHFHTRHSNKNIHYLGNPYQLNWNDYGSVRGFHIFNMKDDNLEFVPNPVSMFDKIVYGKDQKDLNEYKNMYIKLIVNKSTNRDTLNKYISDLYEVGIHDLKVVEMFNEIEVTEELEVESVSTPTLIKNYVEALEIDVNKKNIIDIMNDLYKESAEV